MVTVIQEKSKWTLRIYQFFGHVLRDLMSVVGIHNGFHESPLLSVDLHFLLKKKTKRIITLLTWVNWEGEELHIFPTWLRLCLPWTVWWSRRPVCCLCCPPPPSRFRATVPATPWCTSAAFSTYTGSLSAGLPGGDGGFTGCVKYLAALYSSASVADFHLPWGHKEVSNSNITYHIQCDDTHTCQWFMSNQFLFLIIAFLINFTVATYVSIWLCNFRAIEPFLLQQVESWLVV